MNLIMRICLLYDGFKKIYGFLGKDIYKNVARSFTNKEKLEITQLPIYQLENE